MLVSVHHKNALIARNSIIYFCGNEFLNHIDLMTYGIGLISVESECGFPLLMFGVPSKSNGFKLNLSDDGLLTIINFIYILVYQRNLLPFVSVLTLSE